jgi:hypothetical protein
MTKKFIHLLSTSPFCISTDLEYRLNSLSKVLELYFKVVMTVNQMTLSIMTLSIMTLSIMTLSIITLSIMIERCYVCH